MLSTQGLIFHLLREGASVAVQPLLVDQWTQERMSSSSSSTLSHPVRRARRTARGTQLGELAADLLRRLVVLDGMGEQADDVVVAPEVSEVLERMVDGASQRATTARVTELADP